MKISRIMNLAVHTLLAVVIPAYGNAATSPLNDPLGLAVSSSGDLYVANYANNNILIYNSAHLLTGTITQGVSGPDGVALDPGGNLWVANDINSSVTNYSAAGVQNTSKTITSGVSVPRAIAVDGLYDVFINNNFYLVGIWPASLQGEPLTTQTFGGQTPTGIATYKDTFVVGSNSYSFIAETYTWAQSGTFFQLSPTCYSPAFDSSGNLYCGNIDNTLTVIPSNSDTVTVLATLPFFPSGLAIDNKRGWIYVSNSTGNEIDVYNLAGKLLHIIK